MTHRTHDEVARLAYDLFLSRGQAHGRDLDDWFEAERQVQQSRLADQPPPRNGSPAARTTRAARRRPGATPAGS